MAGRARRKPSRVVVVGAGLAGGMAALAARDAGFEGEIVLLGSEPHPPYARPPLSKEFLRGEREFARTLLRRPEDYEQRGIDRRPGVTVVAIDPAAGAVRLADGDDVSYDRLVLATGSRNRSPEVPGLDLEGVFDLRTVEDSTAIREAARPGVHAVIAGMGFIGSEASASLRALGAEVTALMSGDGPLERALGPDVAGVLAAIHEERGVRLLGRSRLAAFEGEAGRVRLAVTASGERIACDLAVVGVGVRPNVELAADAGVAVGDGVLVDGMCRTDAPGVLAAGDVAAFPHPAFGRRIRVEHWQHAVRHGRAAGLTAAGEGAAYEELPWFWSDQYEHNIQYTGWHRTWDSFEVRGSLEERSFLGFFVEDGVVRAAVAMNRGRDLRRAADLIRSRLPVEPARLRDESIDVGSVA